MGMTIYKLYSGTAGDSVASLDIQLDGEIESILMSCDASGVNLMDEGVQVEVSFLSTNTFAVNDSRGSLMIIQSRSGLLTSGALNSAINMSVSALGVPVAAGERIHLHILDIGTISGRTGMAYLYVRDKGVSRMAPRRR